MTKIILVTHALTQWNVEGRTQCHVDTPLNETGRRMADLLAERLADEPISAIYASDLRRAGQTAAPLARIKSLPILKDIRLREGRWPSQEETDEYPTLPFHTEQENRADVRCRMIEALTDIAQDNPGCLVLVVSHSNAVHEFIHHVMAESGDSGYYEGRQTAINLLQYTDGRWKCLHLNDIRHLREIG